MHEKKSQAETGVETVFQIFLFLRCFYVYFCLCVAFRSLPSSPVVTGFINLHITELVDISPLPTQIQFAITISATPPLQCGQHFQLEVLAQQLLFYAEIRSESKAFSL
jgi:hypothetical protein